MPQRTRKDTVAIIIKILRKKKSFPIIIPTAKCPNRDPKCTLHHGEYVISKYDDKLDRFFVRSYPVHRNEFLESWFDTAKIEQVFIRCIVKKKFTIPQLTEIVSVSHIFRKKQLNCRFTEQEYKKIEKRAKKADLSIYNYVRKAALGYSNG